MASELNNPQRLIYHQAKKSNQIIYESQWKVDQDALMVYDQMRFIFQCNPPCSPHTSLISVAVIESH